MKFQFASDLHLEFPENRKFIQERPLIPTGEYLLLAGDIIPFTFMDKHAEFFDYIADHYKAVYWVPGNHEYYYSDITERSGVLNEKIRENVFLVNEVAVSIGGFRLIFSTLWSKISLENRWRIPSGMADFNVIKYNGGAFTTDHYNTLHQNSLDFLSTELAESEGLKKIIVSHHIPTIQNYPPQYKSSILNEAFAANLDDFIMAHHPEYWIYGHHHQNIFDFNIGHTKLLTNQLGYLHHGEGLNFCTSKSLL